MGASQPTSIERVVTQHVDQSAHLRSLRSISVRAPHVRLPDLGRFDERLQAHLDGLAVAGDDGVRFVRRALADAGGGEIFVATVGALVDQDTDRLDKLLLLAEALPAVRTGLLSAFGWVPAAALRGTSKRLLESGSPWRHEVGLAVCALHRVDPRGALDDALRNGDAGLRCRALHVAGQIGRRALRDACLAALVDGDASCAVEAARSALLLGDRGEASRALEDHARAGNFALPFAAQATLLRAMPPTRAQALLATLARRAPGSRELLHGIACAGDPRYVPWLIGQMEDQRLARIAGEAFTFVTGLDLSQAGLDRPPPADAESGPNDDPDDAVVAMDRDDGLPWPHAAKIANWWSEASGRFAAGTRYFMGETPNIARCGEVLRTGAQRQRIAAAEHLALLSPGRPLFNVAAPAWRQMRLLGMASRLHGEPGPQATDRVAS